MNGKELLNFANELEDGHKDKGYKWLYDKLRYEIIKKHQEAINPLPIHDEPDEPVKKCECCKSFHESDICCYD